MIFKGVKWLRRGSEAIQREPRIGIAASLKSETKITDNGNVRHVDFSRKASSQRLAA